MDPGTWVRNQGAPNAYLSIYRPKNDKVECLIGMLRDDLALNYEKTIAFCLAFVTLSS